MRSPFASLTAAVALMALAACAGDPLARVERLEDVDVSTPAATVEAVAAPEETAENTGFFQRLLRKREVAPAAAAATDDDVGRPLTTTTATTTEAGSVPNDAAPAPATRGLLGIFNRNRPEPVADADGVQLASVDAPVTAAETPGTKTDARARTGFFGAAGTVGAGLDARDAVPGEVLPFGEVARACHVKRGDLGQVVAKYPERGAKYKVYDNAPGNLGLHTFYVTGFRDGCPRQFTAALALFGTAGMYESLRYALPASARSKKPTDKAYEKVKSRICGVSRGKPCGAKIGRMEKNTVFLSLYNRFEGAQGWTNLLLSEGEVVARDVEG
ncbi:hypothetical protein NO357_17525 [Marimonas arenosa]|uniref:Lipoprotein n=1 Tax=Marimonas arenosa TaxID=1795305 RepID=A0AAE3WHC5_9RHOB|nr:hypothetical protein [Marimonas arenosa]